MGGGGGGLGGGDSAYHDFNAYYGTWYLSGLEKENILNDMELIVASISYNIYNMTIQNEIRYVDSF